MFTILSDVIKQAKTHFLKHHFFMILNIFFKKIDVYIKKIKKY